MIDFHSNFILRDRLGIISTVAKATCSSVVKDA